MRLRSRQQVNEDLLGRKGVCDFSSPEDLTTGQRRGSWFVVSDFEAGMSRR